MSEITTLKDIAAVLGVSTTTIHRALNGKGGVSDAMRHRILQLAADMGYTTNLAASALKRKTIRLGALLPDEALEGNYYYASLWEGIHTFMDQASSQNVSLKEFYYTLTPGGHEDAMEALCSEHLDELDGLITLGTKSPRFAVQMQELKKAGLPVVILGADLYKESRLCCVKSCDTMAGAMAAELMTSFLPKESPISILLTGDPDGMVDQSRNAAAFRDTICLQNRPVTLQTAFCSDIHDLDELTDTFLAQVRQQPSAIYACSARHTVKMFRLLASKNLSDSVTLIGNDYFPAIARALRDGLLTATIDKKIVKQSYTAISLLLDHLIQNHLPVQDVIQIRPEIILKSNAEL